MSADSLAMSTALSTEMPTSAARNAGRVVDAVAHEADDVLVALQRLHDAFLVRGRKPRKNVRGFHLGGQLFIGQVFHLVAEQDFFRVNANFAANLAGDEIVVAGQHLDGHAVLPQAR